MSSVIDNESKKLYDILKNELAQYRSDKWKFATGFLFFDGWTHIKPLIPENLNEFDLLFGFTDAMMSSAMATTLDEKGLKIVLSHLSKYMSDKALKEIVEDSTLKNLIEKDRLKIKWIKNLHSKLYLFTRDEHDEVNLDGRAIIGSSNLTTRGLTQPGELNILVYDQRDIRALLEWYKRRWDEAKDLSPEILINAIVNEKARRHLIQKGVFIDIDKKNWTLLDGYLFLFWYLLGGVYDIEEIKSIVDKPTGELLIEEHNNEAVIWGYQIIEKYGGVILADPVGTGKSFQALGIIALLRARKNIDKVLMIMPPHLIKNKQWEGYINSFFKSMGAIDKIKGIETSKVLECEDRYGKFIITLASSYGISLLNEESPIIDKLSKYDVVLIDEAHHFKNIDARKRVILNRIIDKHREENGTNPYTILLTATPIINDVAEILALMSIYTRGETGDFDVLARVELDTDIIKNFEEYQECIRKLKSTELEKDKRDEIEKTKREVLDKIINFLQESIILRSRAYIEKKYWGGRGYRPILKNMRYEFSDDEKEFIKLIENLSLAYLDLSPSTLLFIKKIAVSKKSNKLNIDREMITLQGIMKILLAKRLESSIYAFLMTLTRIKKTMENILELLERENDANSIAMRLFRLKKREILPKRVVDVSEIDLSEFGVYELDERDKEAISRIHQKVLEILSEDSKLNQLKKRIREDITLISNLIGNKNIYEISRRSLSKEKVLIEYLKKVKKEKKKVIIYSMYVDTIEWLEKLLKSKFTEKNGIYKITGGVYKKQDIVLDFKGKAGFAIMLATDALSEGINLEFVDELVNYDIPWTPSTILQRVGRLWRANRDKEILFYTVLPPEELVDSFSTIVEKASDKLNKIKEVLIQEIKLLREEEELTENFEDRVYGSVYTTEEQDLRDFLKKLAEDEPDNIRKLIIDIINAEEIEGKKIKVILKERESEFEDIKKLLDEGKILNLATNTEDIPITMISFGKKYWFKIKGDMKIYSDRELQDVIREKWNLIRENPNFPIKWMLRGKEIDITSIINRFRNRFKTYLTNIIKQRKDTDWKILEPLTHTEHIMLETYEELVKLKNDIFILLAYYLYNKKRAGSRRYAMRTLKELGFISANKTPIFSKYNDINALKQLLDKLKGDVEEMRVEVII